MTRVDGKPLGGMTQGEADDRYLKLAGGTLTGSLTGTHGSFTSGTFTSGTITSGTMTTLDVSGSLTAGTLTVSGSMLANHGDFTTLTIPLTHGSVAASRALDTVYQNGSKLRFVSVTASFGDTPDGLAENAELAIGIGSGTPTTTIADLATYFQGSATSNPVKVTISFFVPPDYYYDANDNSDESSGTLIRWYEWDLG